jgi:hypothetical protein
LFEISRPRRRLAGATAALALLTAIGFAGAALDGAWSVPPAPTWPASRIEVFAGSLHQLEDVLVAVAPHHDHLYGIISVQFLTCGPKVRILTPAQMALRQVTVGLYYRGREVASAHLVDQPRFNFLAVGPPVPPLRLDRDTHEQYPQWSPSFIVKASTGEDTSVGLGGIPGISGVIISYPLRRPAHPCSSTSPDY